MIPDTTASPSREGPQPRPIRPLVDFLQAESAGAVLLAVAAVTALIWANSPWSNSYEHLWNTELGIRLGSEDLTLSLRGWINDGLMAIFFLVVGLEIKRELVEGELANPRRAALPALAALGGMAVPALIYVLATAGTPAISGWGIPMATDIALALGVLGALGSRVPSAVKIFLLALAIVDDIGAIIVIALFYSDKLDPTYLGIAALMIGAVILLRYRGITAVAPYVLCGLALWFALHEGGVHSTIAGIAMGLLAPTKPHLTHDMIDSAELANIDSAEKARETVFLARQSVSEVEWLEHKLHPWSSFVIVPVFALANAGVQLSSTELSAAFKSRVALGVGAGLLLGKPLGILLFTWVGCRLKLVELSPSMGFKHVAAAGTLGGIGFTVSLFVTSLAFEDADYVNPARIAILLASLIAGAIGALAFLSLPAPDGEE
ncbi:MAG TPA: Na+/H+ antiporter NhaA [Acidimicrobiaceae bacterium]|jgi:NhaA family Na+:H+ antiporter|nr:Na+/H+ antiporter NhaA [Acidimicrobiaceae bacterium]